MSFVFYASNFFTYKENINYLTQEKYISYILDLYIYIFFKLWKKKHNSLIKSKIT